MSLEQRVGYSWSLSGDDREASQFHPSVLPPRLRHGNEGRWLRPVNFRTVSASRGRRTTLCAFLMTNACTTTATTAHAARPATCRARSSSRNELVRIFLEGCRRGWCEGLFLTTAIPGRPVK